MKVRDLVKALNMLDQDREIEIGMLQMYANTYCFRSGCAIHEEYVTGNYAILPNNRIVLKLNRLQILNTFGRL